MFYKLKILFLRIFGIPEKLNETTIEFKKAKNVADMLMSCSISVKNYELKVTKYYGNYVDKHNEKYDHEYNFHFTFIICGYEETMDYLADKTTVDGIFSGICCYLNLVYNCTVTYDKRFL